MRKLPFVMAVIALYGLLPNAAEATHPSRGEIITVTLNGQKEVNDTGVPGQGDPDGFAVATLEEDHFQTLMWEISYRNISGESLSGLHIHGPGASPTTNRPIYISFPLLIDLPFPERPLSDGTLGGTLTPLDDPDLASKLRQVFANPSEFYLTLHTTGAGGFPAGAVRGQLPEPGAAGALLLLGTVALARRRRRTH